MSKSCKPAADHEYRNLVIPESKWNGSKRVSEEGKRKLQTRREIESRLEQKRLERELSFDYAL